MRKVVPSISHDEQACPACRRTELWMEIHQREDEALNRIAEVAVDLVVAIRKLPPYVGPHDPVHQVCKRMVEALNQFNEIPIGAILGSMERLLEIEHELKEATGD